MKNENPEVDMTFKVRVFGRAKPEQIETLTNEVRETLLEFEEEYNSTKPLRMHISEQDPK